jgi:hypothetical protein
MLLHLFFPSSAVTFRYFPYKIFGLKMLQTSFVKSSNLCGGIDDGFASMTDPRARFLCTLKLQLFEPSCTVWPVKKTTPFDKSTFLPSEMFKNSGSSYMFKTAHCTTFATSIHIGGFN